MRLRARSAAIRSRSGGCNSIGDADLPWTTATGERYDALTPRATLDAAAAGLGYAALRAQQQAGGDRLLGIGLCTVVESTTYGSAFYRSAGIPGSGHEVATIRVEPSGAVIASCGLMGSGQGYETTLAQAAAAGLGAAFEDVQLQIGNSDIAPYGMGSRGSRGAAAGGGALYMAGQRLKAKLLAIAAALLDLNSPDGLDLREGKVLRRVAEGWAETGLTLAQVARTAHLDPLRLPPGMEPGLHTVLAYDPPAMTYSNSTHACAGGDRPRDGRAHHPAPRHRRGFRHAHQPADRGGPAAWRDGDGAVGCDDGARGLWRGRPGAGGILHGLRHRARRRPARLRALAPRHAEPAHPRRHQGHGRRAGRWAASAR
jgi:CO/xanthine dehydrogenase Mo-binding subunit